MSKYVKNLITDHLRNRLQGVHDALLVNVVGLSATTTNRLRAELQNKNIHVLVVKNSLAARATAGTPLAAMFEGLTGTAAVCWGGEDIVTLAKEVSRLAGDEKFAPFLPRGGVLEGQRLDQRQVAEVSKWPSRTEQLSLLIGQILSPGANLVSQLNSAGGALASQIEQKAEGDEGDEGAGTPDAAGG
jgi:large subunit ribosomal protein L10